MSMNVAAASSAAPMPNCTLLLRPARRRCRRPARRRAPPRQSSQNSVRTSTGMIAVKMNAWTTVGSVWPTLSVPGMMRSGTILQQAEDGRRRRERADAERVEEVGDGAEHDLKRGRSADISRHGFATIDLAVRAAARAHPYKTVNTPRAENSPVIGFMPGTSSIWKVCAKRIPPGAPQATVAADSSSATRRGSLRMMGIHGTRITGISRRLTGRGSRR